MWGHRIPAYYCDECGEFVVAREMPETCPHCGCTHFTQDEDTLDTWFSSALWPFSTLGWPDKTEELDYFYPTDVLVTGYDIIFFWVIRMVFSGYEHTGKSPFHTVLIHGLVVAEPDASLLNEADKWILSRVNRLAKDVTENMDKFELGIAVQKVYDFIWDEFCDWYVETAKYRIYHKEEEKAAADCVLWVLKTVLKQALKLLHPFMPFITEEIYSVLVPEEESLMMSEWPQFHAEWDFPAEENVMEHVKEITRGIRNMRAEMNVPNNRKTKVYVVCEDTEICDGISTLEDLVDFEQEMERLQKEEEKLKKEIKRAEGMLSNERFISKAPEAKVQEEREKLEKYTQMLQQVQERMAGLKK